VGRNIVTEFEEYDVTIGLSLNRFFMKLFRTSNMEIVTYCQEFFGCDLPSVTLRKRYVKLIETNDHS